MGAFKYSPQDGTPAARMADQIPEDVKEDRYHRLMSVQAEISEENDRNLIGTETEVLVEELVDNGDGLVAKGRCRIPGTGSRWQCIYRKSRGFKAW